MREEFWDDLDVSVSLLVQEALRGQDVARTAYRLKKSPSLIYKWANPGLEQSPSLKQFLLLIKFTGNYNPLRQIARACGFELVSRQDPLPDLLRVLNDLVGTRK